MTTLAIMKPQPRPRGGVIIEAAVFGPKGEFTRIWCIDPDTHVERAITVWTTEHKPQAGDQLWWHDEHSPGWRRYGEELRSAFLPAIGRCYDPTA